jgi:hypothetical protein
MDYCKWGEIIFETDTSAIIKNYNDSYFYYIKIFENYLLTEVKINNKTIFNFKDIMNDKENLSSFKR